MTGTKRTAVTLVVITVLLSLVIGVVGIVGVTGLSDTAAELKQHIIVQLQIPLILTACLVGAALSTSGATLQVVLRNPGRSGNYWHYEWRKLGCCAFAIANPTMGYSVPTLFAAFGMFYWCVVIYIYYLPLSKKTVGLLYGCYSSGYCHLYS